MIPGNVLSYKKDRNHEQSTERDNEAELLRQHNLEWEKGEQGAKKQAIINYIDSLPMSAEKKQALYEINYPDYKGTVNWS